MFTVANVIFPAFLFPYVAALMFPIAGIGLLATEFGVYRWRFPSITRSRTFSIVLSSNVVSSIVGIAAAVVLPTGLKKNWQPGHGDIHDARWGTYATLSWFLAWAVSIFVEYLFISRVFRRDELPQLFWNVLIANTASYVALAVLAIGAAQG